MENYLNFLFGDFGQQINRLTRKGQGVVRARARLRAERARTNERLKDVDFSKFPVSRQVRRQMERLARKGRSI